MFVIFSKITFWKMSLSSMYLNTVMKLVSLSSTSFSVIPFADFFSRLSQYFASWMDTQGGTWPGQGTVYNTVSVCFCLCVCVCMHPPVQGLYRWTWAPWSSPQTSKPEREISNKHIWFNGDNTCSYLHFQHIYKCSIALTESTLGSRVWG